VPNAMAEETGKSGRSGLKEEKFLTTKNLDVRVVREGLSAGLTVRKKGERARVQRKGFLLTS